MMSRLRKGWSVPALARRCSTRPPPPPRPSASERLAAKDDSPCQSPLSAVFEGVSPAVHVRPSPGRDHTRVTTLSNGMKVASVPKFGQFCTVGVVVDSGSRYEVAYPSGVSHFVEKMAFGATEKFKSKDDILQRLERYGGICDCQSTRDTFLYAASVDRRGLEATVEILGDAVLRPRVTDEEVDAARQAIRFEIQDGRMNPMQESFTVESIHAAGFSGNTLGLPKVCPEENVETVGRRHVVRFLATHHRPRRMCLAGVGVDHDELVGAAERHFVADEPAFSGDGGEPDRSTAQYTGGAVTKEKDLSNAGLGPTPFPELGHVVIGLEAVSHQHPDFVAFCVLNTLMGGGGSFSAGGPGKGMYTRLYTHVLNNYHWMYNATAFNHAYADAGLFCISAASPPEMLQTTVQVLVSEFNRLTRPGDIKAEELERAKKQLQSMLLMNLESRPVIFEDLARQVLAQGKREDPEHYIQKIGDVTAEDLRRIADKMLGSKPSVAAIGSLKNLPSFQDIEMGLLDKTGTLPSQKKGFYRFK